MKISVTITSYNQIRFLAEAIDSVLGQSLQPDHILIIDDNSSDGSQELIKAYKANHPDLVDILLHERNLGISQTRNEAIEYCKGELHTFLDGDDRFLSEKIESEYHLMVENDFNVIVFGNFYFIDTNGNRLYSWLDEIIQPPGDTFKQVFSRDFPKGSLFRSELVNADVYRDSGGFDSRLENLYEDYDMRIRISKKNRAVYCNRILSEYRIHPGGLSRVNKSKHIRALKYIYDKNKVLLNDIPLPDKRYITRKYMNLLSRMSFLASKEAVSKHEYGKAINLASDCISFKYKNMMT